MFARIPALAEKYYLPHIQPVDDARGRWPTATTEYCHDKIVNKQCIVERLKGPRIKNGYPCTLFMFSTNKHLKNALIVKGLAMEAPRQPRSIEYIPTEDWN